MYWRLHPNPTRYCSFPSNYMWNRWRRVCIQELNFYHYWCWWTTVWENEMVNISNLRCIITWNRILRSYNQICIFDFFVLYNRLPLFEGTDGMIYFVSLVGYNLFLKEDDTANCMVESMNLFNRLVANPFLSNAHLLLFLNKIDLFR